MHSFSPAPLPKKDTHALKTTPGKRRFYPAKPSPPLNFARPPAKILLATQLPMTTAATPLICKTLDSVASFSALTPLNLTSEKKLPTKKASPTRLGPGKPEKPWQT